MGRSCAREKEEQLTLQRHDRLDFSSFLGFQSCLQEAEIPCHLVGRNIGVTSTQRITIGMKRRVNPPGTCRRLRTSSACHIAHIARLACQFKGRQSNNASKLQSMKTLRRKNCAQLHVHAFVTRHDKVKHL